MAKRSRPRPKRDEFRTIRLNLPRPAWSIITEAAKVAGLTPDQIIGAILALRLVTMPKDQP